VLRIRIRIILGIPKSGPDPRRNKKPGSVEIRNEAAEAEGGPSVADSHPCDGSRIWIRIKKSDLDPDPHKDYADPQHWLHPVQKRQTFSGFGK